ncbi:MAG: hypothetical protein FJ348_07285 [Sphingomonadales bacterium]|nr:hypothetical protein [Sphingomonadales bacterium]
MILKKMMLQSCLVFIFSALLVSCDGSEKGKWSAGDKEKARSEMEKTLLDPSTEGSEFFAKKEVRDQFIDCSLGKLEQNYASYSDANNDLEGCKKIGEECALALVETATPTEEDSATPAEQEEKTTDQ